MSCSKSLWLLLVGAASLAEGNELVSKRNSINTNPLPASFNERFVNDILQSVDKVTTLQTPFLIHTEGSLMFINGSEVNRTVPLTTTLYNDLKIVSHLPVSLVSILTPELIENDGKSTQLSMSTIQRLDEFRLLVQSVSMELNSSSSLFSSLSQQQMIVGAVLEFIGQVLSDQLINSTSVGVFVNSLLPQLRQNSHDAVLDYLRCVNDTISSMGLAQSNQLVVILSLDPFSQTESFLVQYYQRLLNIDSQSERLILTPTAQSSMLFKISLHQSISEAFYANSSSSVHALLSESASQLICSPIFMLASCIDSKIIVGFNTKIEKSYVVLMMIFAGLSVLFGTVLTCICYEDRLMMSERKLQESRRNFKLDGPNVLTPLKEETSTNEQSITISETQSYNQLLNSS